MSNQDDKLQQLSRLNPPSATDAARQRALDAALLAFDAAAADTHGKARTPAKGTGTWARLSSIFADARRNWTMETRLTYGFGTAAVMLLMLPLGYQLYTSTALTPSLPARPALSESSPAPAPAPEMVVAQQDAVTAPVANEAAKAAGSGAVLMEAPADAVPAPMAAREAQAEVAEMLAMPAPRMPLSVTTTTAGARAPLLNAAAPTGRQFVQHESGGDTFTSFTESQVKVVAEEPVSTFSIDVDTASYAYVRRALNEGRLPPADAVRVEEMINYFGYDYALPETAGQPFAPTVMVYPAPWDERKQLVQIGIKGYEPPAMPDTASNLVFLIDSSGSMNDADKLPLLKRAFGLLVDRLGDNDTVSIVTYAGSAGVVLPPTPGTQKGDILAALDGLAAGGRTAGSEGIALAYQLAEQNLVEGGVNRVILATDGDFNVGIDNPEELKAFIRDKRDGGVFLSVLGFGSGNLGDDTMQALAQNGNGNASYIDSFREAYKVLVEDAGGTLTTIASDVKIQVEFNPAAIAEYRLIGYETRALAREDFNNDRVDAGEIGAGATVTALYEIVPVGSGAELNAPLRYGGPAAEPTVVGGLELGFVKLRYKLPGETTSTLMEVPIPRQPLAMSLDEAPDDARFAAAVAAFGQKLRGSRYVEMEWEAIHQLAQGARGADEHGHRAEFVRLVDVARLLRAQGSYQVTPGEPGTECATPPGATRCTTR